jgi:hypothetical protein
MADSVVGADGDRGVERTDVSARGESQSCPDGEVNTEHHGFYPLWHYTIRPRTRDWWNWNCLIRNRSPG